MSDAPGVVPREIAEFIADRIGTVAELEGLLILRQEPKARWSAQLLAARLYVPQADAEELLQVLCQNGFAAQEAGQPLLYRYRPASAEVQTHVDRIASLYSTHLIAVTRLIHSRARQRVQGFADAFKFRKGD